jgi:eukaryotic-like serine/threonine-protein kinase
MGTVYEAIDQRLGRTVALKMTFARSAHLRRAFEREARILANLSHPALPRVIDHFSEGDEQFLVMDYVPGPDLKALLQQQGHPFAEAEVLRWAGELLDALEYLHSHEPAVVHRDIKPSNLKLTARRGIVLLDFGLAKGAVGQTTSDTLSRSVMGYSPHFAPPEQMQGERTDPRSDLYSLAATLYHLLTGQVPSDAQRRLTAQLHDESDPLMPLAELNPKVSPHASSVIMRALALKPAQRWPGAAAMRAAFAASADATTVSDLDAEQAATPNSSRTPS